MYLAFDPAQMLPTKTLTGMNETGQTITKRGLKEKRSSAQSVNVGRIGVAGVVLAATALSVIF
jgi:hypothetical protein